MFICNKAIHMPPYYSMFVNGIAIYLEPCCRRTIIYNDTSYFLAFPKTLYRIDYSTFNGLFQYNKLTIGWVLTDGEITTIGIPQKNTPMLQVSELIAIVNFLVVSMKGVNLK